MKEVKVPSIGESIQEATILEWFKQEGEFVEAQEALLSLETDKASVEIFSESPGVLTHKAKTGDTVLVGSIIATIDPDQKRPAQKNSSTSKPSSSTPETSSVLAQKPTENSSPTTPSSRKLMQDFALSSQDVTASGKKGHILKEDVLQKIQTPSQTQPAPQAPLEKPQISTGQFEELTVRKPLSRLRRTLAQRLVQSQNETASLTTFNEVDMTSIFQLRKHYQDNFQKKYGFKLGFMGLFIKASLEALKTFPQVNGFIDGDDMVYNQHHHVGVAVSTEKGLVVPVIRHADKMSLPELEQTLQYYALKAREGRLELNDLSGGTFTVSNGGVFGSLMSTPILNPPQSGILGMHKIEKRPVVINDKIEIRPMMYIALTYDHRVIDGRESVGFLLRIKECVEDPSRILIEV